MNLNPNITFVDGLNTFPILDYIDEKIATGGGGTFISSNIYTLDSNLYINNSNVDGEIRIRVKNNINNPSYSQDHRVRIDKDGKLQLYHVYDPLTPNYPSAWYDVSDEIIGIKFGNDLQELEVIALGATIGVIEGQIEDIYATLTTILTALGNVNNGLEFTQDLLYENDVLNTNHSTLMKYRDNYAELMEDFVGSSTTAGVRQRVIENRSFIVNSVSSVLGGYGLALEIGIPVVAGLVGAFYALQEDRNVYNKASNVSNVNFEITPSQRRQLLDSNLVTSVSNMVVFASNLSNMSLDQGFINSNILTSQTVPYLRTNKIEIGNITTPNSAYQLEMTGDLNTNMLWINSTSLTSLLNEKQNNLTAVAPIYITTGNIGLNYDSSLTKVGNNLSVVKTATAPLSWTGNDISLSYDSTLLNNSGSLGVSIGAESKWSFTGGNIYNKSLTNVGIGTLSSITSKLTIHGDIYTASNINCGIRPLTFITSFTNSTMTQVSGSDEFYLQYTTNGTLVLNEPSACDLLVVGAGGNGGTGAFSGGGGAGEVIYYPNFPLRNGTLTINVGTSSTTPANRISSITHSTGTQISAKGGGNGAYTNNQSLFNLFKNKPPWGMYFAENWSGTSLPDSSGNGRHATTAGTITKTTASGNGATGAITYISGGTGATISFPTGSIPSNFTILGLTRYTGGTRARILNSRGGGNWLHGHWSAKRGMAFYEAWKTNQTSIGTLDDWLCCIGKNDPRATGFNSNILLDGSPYAIATGGTGNYNLGVNFDYEQSDWALSCVMIWNQHLTDAEMVLLNNMVNQYKTDGVYMLNVINSITSATSGGSGGGGIVGTTSAGAVAGTKFDDYKSFAQAGLNGSSTLGGNGGSGSSLYNTRFTTTITGSSLSVGLGGTGVGASPATPVVKSNYGDGGDGNGGVGFQGIVIIRFKNQSTNLHVKAIKDNANTGIIINANESPTSYQLRVYPWSDTYQLTGIATRGWSFRCHDGNNNLDLLNLFSSFGGRVGVKTKNPTATLDVNGDIACKTFSVVGSELYGITCQVVNQDTIGEASINISAGASGNYGAMSVVYLPSENLGYINCSKSLQIKTQSIGGYIHIDNSTGYVGIGNNLPQAKLHVDGTILASSVSVTTVNADSIASGNISCTSLDLNNGSIIDCNRLNSVDVWTGPVKATSLDLDGGNITNGGFFYGMAQQARFLNMSVNEWHYDTQSRNRFYFTNDGTSSHTVFRTGSTTHYFQDKDATDYCLLDRFGISTYFEVISGGGYDNIGCLDASVTGVYVYRKMLVRLSTFTEVHRCFCEDELYIDYDQFINEFIGRVVVSKGKIKTALKEVDKQWEILEGKDGITIDDSHAVVQLSRKRRDKAVVGVITKRNQNNDLPGRLVINSLGETGIWIVNTGGNIETGDLITTSNELGYGEKQDDDIIHNYTIGKSMIDCSFELDSPNYKCEVLGNDIRRAFLPIFIYSG